MYCYDPYKPAYDFGGLKWSKIKNVFSEKVIYVSLHTPKYLCYKNMINKGTLSMMKPTAFQLIRQEARWSMNKDLYEACKNHVIAGGAALDAVVTGPFFGYAADHSGLMC